MLIHGWKELSEYTGLSVRELKRYAKEGAFEILPKHRKWCSRVKFSKEEVDRWYNRLFGKRPAN